MSWSLVIAKATVEGDDPARVEKVAGLLALALRNAADVMQAENYNDVRICIDGTVVNESAVREDLLSSREVA